MLLQAQPDHFYISAELFLELLFVLSLLPGDIEEVLVLRGHVVTIEVDVGDDHKQVLPAVILEHVFVHDQHVGDCATEPPSLKHQHELVN